MTSAPQIPPVPTKASMETTVYPIIFAVGAGHFLNDLMQALIPASYPLLQQNLGLSFAQIGMITMVFQGTGSILQPLVGTFTDRRPMAYGIVSAMASTGLGLVMLAHAASLMMVLLAVALVGLGSAIFHPEASRLVRLAAGMRPGFAQSIFQVGGNAGTAFGPLAAGYVIMKRGQISIEWFALVAMLGMVLLAFAGRWYVTTGAGRAKARKARAQGAGRLPVETVKLGVVLIIALMGVKFFYNASFSSYYTFYLMEQFDLTTEEALNCLFIYLAAVAAGTIIGGPIGDRIGRRRIIIYSMLATVPFALILPWLPLIPTVIVAAMAGLVLASAFPAMMVYAQDLLPQHTGMVAGLMFGFAFGVAAFGAAVLGVLADYIGIVAVYKITAFLPLLGIVALLLPDNRP